ncbi:uncharacterized protein [Salminus brasiliensis]|uniref:uncharacterized protein n=1 Tax=Salminus brasiliensis TaxID=930266 RepID=UPI003B830FB8
MPLPVPDRPWSHLAVDFVTDLPESGGYTVVMTVVDRFSRGVRFIPFPTLPPAMQAAQALVDYVLRNFGIPEDIVSDRGAQFTSQVWGAFCEHLGVSVSLSSGYHPQTNGQCERTNQELGKFLRIYCHDYPSDWSRYLVWAEMAQNSLRCASSVYVRLPTPVGPLDCCGDPGTSSRCMDALQRSRLGRDPSAHPDPFCGATRHRPIGSVARPRHTRLEIACGSPHGTFGLVFRLRNWQLSTWVHSRLSSTSTRFLLRFVYPCTHVYILCFMCRSSSLWCLGPWTRPPLRTCSRSLWRWKGLPLTRSGEYWTPDGAGADCSICWTGKGMVRRNAVLCVERPAAGKLQ